MPSTSGQLGLTLTVKQLPFNDDARDKIRRGVDALAQAVKVTLGPRGRTVILERDFGSPQLVLSTHLKGLHKVLRPRRIGPVQGLVLTAGSVFHIKEYRLPVGATASRWLLRMPCCKPSSCSTCMKSSLSNTDSLKWDNAHRGLYRPQGEAIKQGDGVRGNCTRQGAPAR